MEGGRTIWDKKTTKVFLDLCIAEKNKANYNRKGLTRLGWQNLYRNFRQETGRTYDKKQLQNKFNTLKRQYKVWRKLKDRSGGRWDKNTGTIDCDDERWRDRIAEDEQAKQFRENALPYADELYILFSSMDSEGGIGDRTPSGGSEKNLTPMSNNNATEDNVGRSSVGRAAHRSGKEHVADSRPPKKTKSMEYYVEPISESMLERKRNERSAVSREQEGLRELLKLAEHDGVPNGSELYFIATELFRSPARRAAYRSITAAENRIAWLRWTWDNVKKK